MARRYASLVREDVILRSETMGQPGFFDADKRLAALSKKGDPLEAIAALVPWESFRADIEAVALTPDAEKKSRAGRKPFDAILMFRMLILQSLYNLSDEQIEYQVRDRMSSTRFLGLEFEDDIPDGTTFFAGFSSHAASISPRFTVSFSSRLLRCFGTGTIVASTIWPPRAMYPFAFRCS